MWLQYSLDKNDNLVSVHDCPRGRSDIRCPYCQGELIAKKGKVKAHHFAHVEETCNWAARASNFNLPLFLGFDLVLSRSYLNTLKELEQRDFRPKQYALRNLQKRENRIFGYLKRKKVIRESVYYQVELTDLGRVVLKKPTLLEFCEIQEKLSQEKYIQLQKKVISSEDFYSSIIERQKTRYEKSSNEKKKIIDYNLEFGEQELKQAQTDLIIYHAQYQRVLQNSLYFLEITTQNETFYKIGVTSRNIKERLKEIDADLSKFFSNFDLRLLGIWWHRGNAEHYFKYRYEDYKFPLGTLTEYFKFERGGCVSSSRNMRRTESPLSKHAVENIEPYAMDFNSLLPKELNGLEQNILNNSADKLLLSSKVRRGMERASLRGVHTGRPSSSSESTNKFLAKSKNKAIATVLKKGLSLRQAAKETGASVNTVRKVKAALENGSAIKS